MSQDQIRTRIWQEVAEADNPFATHLARCHGFDVYGELLGRISWSQFLLLLFCGEPPAAAAAALLDCLAVALANPGPRDPSVHAAMSGGTSGTPAAAILMATLAVGAGGNGGGREILLAVSAWRECGTDATAWRARLSNPAPASPAGAWPAQEHPAGFDPHGVSTSLPVRQTLEVLADLSPGPILPWLAANRRELEAWARLPLAMSGVAAAALADLDLTPEQAEILYLMLRLPGAAAHALEQAASGHKKFPFYRIEFDTEPSAPNSEARP